MNITLQQKTLSLLQKLKKPRFFIPVIIVCSIIGFIIFNTLKNPFKDIETERVSRTTISERIAETGTVRPAQSVDLTVIRPGSITSVLVDEGDIVKENQLLVTTDSRSAQADVATAQARLDAELSRLEELLNGASEHEREIASLSVESAQTSVIQAQKNIALVQTTQDKIVQSALDALLNTALSPYLISRGDETGDYSYTPPSITGTYSSSQEGFYRIQLYPATNDTGWAFSYSGLESGKGVVSTVKPQPLGTRGLYIMFPDNFTRRGEVIWEIQIPNIRSASYTSLNNTYQQALISRTNALEQARQQLTSAELAQRQTVAQQKTTLNPARPERIVQQQALVKQARMALWQAQIALSQTSVYSPFDGTVTSVNAVKGQYAGATALVSVMSDAEFEIILDVSESDVTSIERGDMASVTFDAYKDQEFKAKIVSINPSASDKNGVKIFKTILQFVENDPRIKAGLTADVEIYAEEKKQVLAIPTRALFEKDDQMYVRVRNANGDIIERSVMIGLKGSDGKTEITRGLAEGDEVITFLTEKQLELLKQEEEKKESKK